MKNKATRRVCDLRIFAIDNMYEPILTYTKANVTGFNLTGDTTSAKVNGEDAIDFSNPMGGTIKVEAQVVPFEIYSLIAGGKLKTDAVVSEQVTIACSTAGKLTIPTGAIVGSVFVYPEDSIGVNAIKGTFATDSFTATTPTDITVGKNYEVSYFISKTTGIRRIEFNDKNSPKALYIEMLTYQKDEDDCITPYRIICYKTTPLRNMDLSFTSDGDPMGSAFEFKLAKNKKGQKVDMIEWIEPEV